MANWKDDVRSLVFEYVEEKWLTHGEALVLLRLADYANWTNGQDARPGNWLLAERLAMSEDTVGSALTKGVKLDLIALTKRGGGTGSSRTASNYRFLSEYLPNNSPAVWKSKSAAPKTVSRTGGKSAGTTSDRTDGKASRGTVGRTSGATVGRTSGATAGGTTGRGGVLPTTPATPRIPTSSKTPTEPRLPVEVYKDIDTYSEEEILEAEKEMQEVFDREARHQLDRKRELERERKQARQHREIEHFEKDWFS